MAHPAPRWTDNDLGEPAAARTNWIAILPLGAHEQHGPHLPLETDTLIAEGLVDRFIAACPSDLPVTFLPAEPVGYSIEHMHAEGTATLSYREATERWLGIAQDLHGLGIRKFVMLNAHGGNAPLMTVVATEARVRFGMLAVATSWTRFGQPEGWMTPEAKAIDIHAGDIETSVMLALHPERVDMRKAAHFPSLQSELAERNKYLRAYGPHAFGWRMSDLNANGAAGNAAAATAERGETLILHVLAGFQHLLRDVDRFDLSILA